MISKYLGINMQTNQQLINVIIFNKAYSLLHNYTLSIFNPLDTDISPTH